MLGRVVEEFLFSICCLTWFTLHDFQLSLSIVLELFLLISQLLSPKYNSSSFSETGHCHKLIRFSSVTEKNKLSHIFFILLSL